MSFTFDFSAPAFNLRAWPSAHKRGTYEVELKTKAGIVTSVGNYMRPTDVRDLADAFFLLALRIEDNGQIGVEALRALEGVMSARGRRTVYCCCDFFEGRHRSHCQAAIEVLALSQHTRIGRRDGPAA